MLHFRRLAVGVDVVPVLAALSRQTELWDQETLRTTHPETPHGAVSDIWIRFNDLTEWKKTGDPSAIIDQHEIHLVSSSSEVAPVTPYPVRCHAACGR